MCVCICVYVFISSIQAPLFLLSPPLRKGVNLLYLPLCHRKHVHQGNNNNACDRTHSKMQVMLLNKTKRICYLLSQALLYVYPLWVWVIMKNATVWSWRLWSLTIKSIEDHCGCLHGLKAGPEHSLDNHVDLRHSLYDLQQHLTDLQKPDKARSSRMRVLKCYQIKAVLGS